jgi:hypothetical protein
MAILAIPKHVREGNQCRRARFWDKVSFICNTIMGDDTMSKVNYTEELTTKIVADYEAGLPVEDIALSVDRSVRSIRSKLVREGVYKAAEKTPAKKVGPSKKELLIELEGIAPFEVDGLSGATKTAISTLIDHFKGEA